jgi:hypothetical protein
MTILQNLANEFHPVNKPQFKRIKLTQRQKGEISAKVRDIVNARTIFAPVGCCERCKKNRHGFMRLELAHIDSRGSIDHKTTENDLLRLCSPSTDSRTCHYFSHSPEGYEWMKDQQVKLLLREGA